MDNWIADVVGKMHVNKISQGDLAKHLGYTGRYVCMVLNGKRTPRNAEVIFTDAVNKLIEKGGTQ